MYAISHRNGAILHRFNASNLLQDSPSLPGGSGLLSPRRLQVAVEGEDGHEGFLGDFDAADHLHARLSAAGQDSVLKFAAVGIRELPFNEAAFYCFEGGS